MRLSQLGHFGRVSLLLTTFLVPGALLEGGQPGETLRLAGALSGSVQGSGGVPQMGATVALYDRYEKLLTRALTDAKGQFAFDNLLADQYSIRVTLASYMPALKRNISVLPGMKQVLAINLASALSSIELVTTIPAGGALLSDDWKWVLRSTMSTRPILRALDDDVMDNREKQEKQESVLSNVFSDTRGLVRIASGESMPFATLTNQPELGTSFALATSVLGANRIRVTGNLGYATQAGGPSTAFRASFSRVDGTGPQTKLTVRQWSLPGRFANQTGGAPDFRSASLTVVDRLQLTDDLEVEYGSSVDTITYLDRITMLSPFARASYHLGDAGSLRVAYSNGAPPVELLPEGLHEDHDGLQQDLAALSLLPRMSLQNGTVRVQRTETVEVGYTITESNRTYTIAAFRERVGSGAVTVLDGASLFGTSELLPEFNGNSAAYGLNRFARDGYLAAVTQDLLDSISATLAYGYSGSQHVAPDFVAGEGGRELRDAIRSGRQQWVMLKISGDFPGSGTRFSVGYQFMDYSSLAQPHVYLTNRYHLEPGLNVRLRQAIPFVTGIGRLEATAELRNILAQGYVPVNTLSGRRLMLTNYPRALRGGLSFIF
ncbi:MAG TPA: TonB-dependent receptor [Bryobacteraceae bacterium]|nr:TonB-dependent receptor [Bryobacteraceae bacterium]